MLPTETDVLVVGGGPAGLATAIACRTRGHRVVVADYRRPPLDKACGEGLLPDGLIALGELGVELRGDQRVPFLGIRFRDGNATVEGTFPHGTGVGVRRTTLHDALVQRARDAGAQLVWGTQVKTSASGVAFVGNRSIAYRWLVGADGAPSRVRAWTGLGALKSEDVRYGFRRHVRTPPWTDYVEVYWGNGCQAYVTPISDSEVCVAFISRDPRRRLDSMLAEFPDLAMRLQDCTEQARDRGAVTASRLLRRVASANVALVGDAAGSVDAITGQGLGLAFRQALDLADAITRDDLRHYASRHRAMMRLPFLMGRLMLMLGERRAVRTSALRLLSSRPAVFEELLSLHVGEKPTIALVSSIALHLGASLIPSRPDAE
jgi:menaquinone-9 beta-reductase